MGVGVGLCCRPEISASAFQKFDSQQKTDKSQSNFGTAYSIPDIGTSNATVINVATILITEAQATDQLQAVAHCFLRAKPGVGSSLDWLPKLVNSENWSVVTHIGR